MELREIEIEEIGGVDRTGLAQDRNRRNAVMNLWIQ
jgi:hypothetical protein